MMLAWWSKELRITLSQNRRGVAVLLLDLCCIDVAAPSQDGVAPATTSNKIPQFATDFSGLHANPAGAVGALTLSRGRC